MEHSPDSNGLVETAMHYAELGYRCIPVRYGAKAPPLVKWKPYQDRSPTAEEYRAWFSDVRRNIAILTGDIVVADVDDPSLVDLVMEKCGETNVISKTPHGLHLWYRKRQGTHVGNRVDVRGRDFDLRAEGGYAIVDPSRAGNGSYEWLGSGLPAKSELPLFKVSWTRERVRRSLHPIEFTDHPDVMVRRARSYIAHIEGAISGQRGHDRTFRVACVLIQKFGLTTEQAWPLFLEWNQQCEPPWSERELLHKLQDAHRVRFTNPRRNPS
jgi:hypothetical protein